MKSPTFEHMYICIWMKFCTIIHTWLPTSLIVANAPLFQTWNQNEWLEGPNLINWPSTFAEVHDFLFLSYTYNSYNLYPPLWTCPHYYPWRVQGCGSCTYQCTGPHHRHVQSLHAKTKTHFQKCKIKNKNPSIHQSNNQTIKQSNKQTNNEWLLLKLKLASTATTGEIRPNVQKFTLHVLSEVWV